VSICVGHKHISPLQALLLLSLLLLLLFESL
jgi:hypothetical protein